MDPERLQQFQELIALEPHDTVLRFGLGELYIEAGDFAHAAEQFAAIVRLDPQYSAAYRYLGQAYAALDRPAEAEAVTKVEGNMLRTVRRGATALPWSETPLRMKGTHRNLGDLTSPKPLWRSRAATGSRGGEAVAGGVRSRTAAQYL